MSVNKKNSFLNQTTKQICMKKNKLFNGRGKLSRHLTLSFLLITALVAGSSLSHKANAAGLLEFKIEDNNNVYWDRLLMAFDSTRSDLKENYDAAKMSNPEVNFYSFSSDNQKLSIDVRPFAHNKTIRLGLTTPYKKDYFIRVVQLNMPTGMQLQLIDKYLNATVTLSVGAKYNFVVNNDSLSQGNNRFEFKCIDPAAQSVQAAPLPFAATLSASPQYLIAGQDAYTIYKGYGAQQVTLSAAVTGGTPGYTYSWTPTTGVAYPTAAITSVAPNVTTTYTVTVTDSANNTKTLSQTVYVIDASCDSGKVKVCNNGTSLCILPGDVSAFLADTPNHYLGTCLSVGAVVANVSCNGGTNGGINVTLSGARPPYTYTWSNSAATEDISGLASGQYTINVSSANGKTTSKTITVGEPALLEVTGTATDVSCYGGNNGQVELNVAGGNNTFSYLWNDNATMGTRTGLPAGTYAVTVTDDKGCIASNTFTVNEPALLSVAGNVLSNVSCNGGDDGALEIIATGGTGSYTYLWNDNATTLNRSGIAAGTYSITVTDSNGCTAGNSFIVNQPTALNVSGIITNATCYGGTNGQLQISATGGIAPYTYLWSNNSTSTTRTNLSAGSYSVIVTDSSGCTAQKSFAVAQPADLSVAVSVSPEYTVSGQDAYTIYRGYGPQTVTLTSTVTGGTAGYSYNWSPTNTVSARYSAATDVTPSLTTNYKLIVTDVKGCTKTVYQKILVENVKCGSNNSNKVNICHDGVTKCVTQSEAATHIAHGDNLGSCGGSKSTGDEEEESLETMEEQIADIKVYPNPSTGIFNINLPGTVKGGSVYVLDMNGRTVEKNNFNADTKLSVDLNHLPNGIYIMQVMNGTEAYRIRVALID
jgi:hypothetical protein